MKYIFFTGMGRSGTLFLSRLFTDIPGIVSKHEYIGDREYWLLSWYLSHTNYSKYYLAAIKADIEKHFNTDVFIDTNGYLQNSTQELQAVFHPVKIYHLVRDPRKVIRSLYTRRNNSNVDLIPKNDNEIKMWLNFNKFERICWNWNNTTRNLLKQGHELILFEKLTGDYKYLEQKILTPCNITLSYESWDAKRNAKVNKTRSALYRFVYAKLKGKKFVPERIPDYTQWPDEYITAFEKICGETMREVGYD